MNYTNKYNLPSHICKWLSLDEYDYNPNVLSATTLISPARAWALKKTYADKLEMDYSDMLSLRYGTAIHDSLEKVSEQDENHVFEKRFFADIMGFTISGKMDAVINGTIRDNKSTSVWKYVKKEFDDYIKQLSIYRWLLAKNGMMTSQTAYIDFFFTDWKKSESQKGGGYPPIRYQEQAIELWNVDKTEKFIADRIGDFIFAESVLPECTPEELWQTPTTYAVYAKPGQARAKKVCMDKEEASNLAAQIGGVVEERKGKAKRCEYCSARPFCDQAKKLQETGLLDD